MDFDLTLAFLACRIALESRSCPRLGLGDGGISRRSSENKATVPRPYGVELALDQFGNLTLPKECHRARPRRSDIVLHILYRLSIGTLSIRTAWEQGSLKQN